MGVGIWCEDFVRGFVVGVGCGDWAMGVCHDVNDSGSGMVVNTVWWLLRVNDGCDL